MNDKFTQKVMGYFNDMLCPTYRKTYDEKQISDKLVAFAKERNLEVIRKSDEDNGRKMNVIVFKKGTGKHESSSSPVIFQAHMDMVCVPIEADFSKGVAPYYPQNPNEMMGKSAVTGKETTLGADDGIGVATILAILDGNDIVHPPIIAVFTVEEEDGMGGARNFCVNDIPARAWGVDLSKAKFINVDDEQDGQFSVGCAGSIRAIPEIPLIRERSMPSRVSFFTLSVSGLSGGHSGIEIHENRANANILLCEVIQNLAYASLDLSVFSIKTQTVSNVIPNSASAIIAVPSTQEENLKASANKMQSALLKKYGAIDPKIKLTVAPETKVEKPAYTYETLLSLISIVRALPNGALTYSVDRDNLVETSSNLGSIEEKLENRREIIKITCMIRSSIDAMR